MLHRCQQRSDGLPPCAHRQVFAGETMASVQVEAAQFNTRLDLGTREEGLET